MKDIRRATPAVHFSAEDKIRIVLEGLRGDGQYCRALPQEGIAQSLYYTRLEGIHGSREAAWLGDTARAATTDEVKDLRREASALKAGMRCSI